MTESDTDTEPETDGIADSNSETDDRESDDGEVDDDTTGGASGKRLETIRERVPWRRLGNAIGVVLLIAVVLPFVIYAVPQVVGADGSYVVLSGSMEPEISPGDVIVVESVDPSEVEEGDVITYARGGEAQATTHRVVDVREGEEGLEFRTKGDANEEPDSEPVAASQVQGRVMTVGRHLFVIPYIGYVIQFAGTQFGFLALVVTPLALFVLSEVRAIVTSTDGASDGGTVADDASDSGTAAAGDASGDDDGTAAGDPSTSSDGGLTFGAGELGLGLVVTGAFAVYSVWVAYVTLAVWAVGVAASVATAFLLLAGLYVSGRTAEADGDGPSAEDVTFETSDDAAADPGDELGDRETADERPSLGKLWGADGERDGPAFGDPRDEPTEECVDD